jgi:hypothetical protein
VGDGAHGQDKELPGDYSPGGMTESGFLRLEASTWKGPIFFASCRSPEGSSNMGGVFSGAPALHMLVYIPGEKRAEYEFFSPNGLDKMVQQNVGPVTIGQHVEIGEIKMGGPPEITMMQLDSEYFIRKGMRLLQPSQFKSAIFARPMTVCPTWDDVNYNEVGGVEKEYKKRGWTRPAKWPSLPGSSKGH